MRKIIILLSVFFLLLSIPGCKKKLLITFTFANINSWQELFTEPFEIVYVIMDDRTIFPFSDQDEKRVIFIVGALEKQLRTPERDYKIKDIAVIIHNHFLRCRFSPKDHKQHRRLKHYGFKGLFLLYCHRTKEVYDIEENKKERRKK